MFERKNNRPINHSQVSCNKNNIRKTVFGVTIVGLLGYTTGALFPNLPPSPRINLALGAFAFIGILSMVGLILFLYISPLLSRNSTTDDCERLNDNDIRSYKKEAGTTVTSEASVHTSEKLQISPEEDPLNNLQTLRKDEIAKFDLTPREYEVALLLLSCDTYDNIAQQEYCSESNVKSHARSIFQKAKVTNRDTFKDFIWRQLVKRVAEKTRRQ